MLETGKIMTFLAVSDREQARRFYGDDLGLRLVADEEYALVFDANGTMLRISPVGKPNIAPYTVLGWEVADIRGTLARLAERGIVPERYPWMPPDEAGVFTFPNGDEVTWFKDPDGNLLSLTHFGQKPDLVAPASAILPAQSGPGSIGWLDLTVPNAEEVRDFYAASVGWTHSVLDGDYAMHTRAGGPAVAGVCHARGINADLPPDWLPYFVVENLEASLAACRERGGTVTREPLQSGLRFAVIRDPAGAVAAFWEKAESRPKFIGAYPISGSVGALPVKDLGSAIAFYTRVLGFRVEDRAADMALLRRDDAVIGLATNGEDPEQTSCYFAVQNLAALHEELVDAGLDPTEMKPTEYNGEPRTIFFAKEPYGVCFCFGERRE